MENKRKFAKIVILFHGDSNCDIMSALFDISLILKEDSNP